jgi:phenylpyruvate tautomerase PptA (4-oxalocrotonate tautomerase family)
MPYFSITSNIKLDTSSNQIKTLSETVAQSLSKPESYVMVSVQYNPDMLFAGNMEPLAFCQLKSLGLQESQTANLSQKLCTCIHELFAIEPSRIYIEFSSPPRPMWGWDKRTF